MAPASPSRTVSRRGALGGALTLVYGPALAVAPQVVTILGDSITAGYGLSASEALPAQLQESLRRLGVTALVRGAGLSGDTTGGGLARLAFSVQPDTRLCIVALGGNDLLRGLEPSLVRANLEGIVRRLRARRMGVLVAGVVAPEVIGSAYARAFTHAFADAARAQGAAFYPDLLAGVAGRPSLNQPDGIHPNAAGVRLIAGRLAPAVARVLRARR